MISFKPAEARGDVLAYGAYDENAAECGMCRFALGGYDMKILSVEGEDIICEGLLRSSMNFCAQRGAYIAHFEPEIIPAAVRLGFSAEKTAVEIPDALASSCCSCGK